MTYRRAGSGTYANQDDIRPATATHQGLMSKADKAKLDAATSAATPSTLVLRDASGNVGAVTFVGALQGNADAATNLSAGGADGILLHGATSSPTASTLAKRNASGFLDDPAWTGLSYATNWSDHGESPGQYHKRVDGQVEVMGLVKKSIALVANDVIATLPAGGTFRPATNRRFAQVSALGYTEIVVNTAGQIFIAAGAGGAGASPAYVSLAGLHFDPAQ